jgi:chemotaxis methyl-accepting protein methylase
MFDNGPEIPSTSWLFRDESTLKTGVELVQNNKAISKVAVVGCATGEQVYSLQTLFHNNAQRTDIEIDGYDAKISVLDKAREAEYHPAWKHFRTRERREMLEKFFGVKYTGENSTVFIPEKYQQGITFNYHDIRVGPLPTIYDLIFCSNLLSYFAVGTDPRHQPTLTTILYNLSQSLDEQGVLLTEPPPEAARIPGSAVNTYLKTMDINPYFRSAPQLVVPIYEFIEFPRRERFLAEETRAYVKKI